MVLRQPITRVWGHQERLLTIARQEVHGHALKCLNPLGRTGGLCDTHDEEGASGWGLVARSLSSAAAVRTAAATPSLHGKAVGYAYVACAERVQPPSSMLVFVLLVLGRSDRHLHAAVRGRGTGDRVGDLEQHAQRPVMEHDG